MDKFTTEQALAALERCLKSEEDLAAQIEAANPDHPYVALAVRDDIGLLRAFAARLREDGRVTVPGGWKLVPVEPTQKMINAALALHGDDAFIVKAPALVSALVKIHKAMLSAAPTSTSEQGEG